MTAPAKELSAPLKVALLGGVVLTLAVAALLEGVAVFVLHVHPDDRLAAIGALLAHVASVGWCGEALRLRAMGRDAAGRGSFHAMGLLVGAVPVFGVVSAALLTLGRLRAPGKAAAQKGLSLEQRRAQAMAAAQEERRAEQQVGADLDSIVDALKDRDKKVRIAAIEALRGDTSVDAVRVLARSRDNTVFDVRMRAVEGLARIAKQYNDGIAALRASLATDPQSPELHRKLAEQAVTYGGLGLEEPQTNRSFFELAVKHAQAAVELGGDDGRAASLILARAWRQLGQYGRTERVYRELLESDEHDVEALVGVAEAQFLQGNFTDLRSTSRWVLRQAGQRLDTATTFALKFWIRASGGERA